MYFVKIYNDNKCLVNAPFESKNRAISYFNKKCDPSVFHILDFDHIELTNESTVLFEWEV